MSHRNHSVSRTRATDFAAALLGAVLVTACSDAFAPAGQAAIR